MIQTIIDRIIKRVQVPSTLIIIFIPIFGLIDPSSGNDVYKDAKVKMTLLYAICVSYTYKQK